MQKAASIAPVAPGEYPELVALWEASVRATHHFLTEADIQYLKPRMLHEYLEAVQLFCIKEGPQITGFIGVAGNKVEMLFIHPQYRGKGIGKSLMQYGISQLGITTVDVNEQNRQAVDFYRHLGFKITGRSDLDGLGKPYPLLHLQLQQQL